MSGLISSHEPLTRVPILILYPHSRCNCRCVMCDIWRAGDTNEIDPDLLAEMIVDWKALGVEEIVLSGGEALMHRRIEELLALLHRSAFRLTLLSTGLLLERHAEAVARTCAEVVLSL
ncbi:MAG: radical SAM protein, partial [Gemmatimonadetes bacterium]|nr:radical SAM protein [Gemmatimonadota bacterium]